MDKNKKETVCAVVVTYNRKQLLLECLDSLLKQTYSLDAIYIIDNASTDGTPELLVEKGYINKALSPDEEPMEDIKTIKLPAFDRTVDIHCVRMHENTGGAGGFHEGVKRGYEKGFDWLWLMDDDCKPHEECLGSLLKYADKNIILGPVVLDEKKRFVWLRKNITEEKEHVLSLPFHGFFINKIIIKEIGYPIKEFFIYGDDREYSFRGASHKYGLFVVKNAVMYHPQIKKNLRRTFVIFNKALLYHNEMNPDRLYYYLRNNLLIFLIYSRYTVILELVRVSISFVIFSKSRFIYLKELFRAISDAVKIKSQLISDKNYHIEHKRISKNPMEL